MKQKRRPIPRNGLNGKASTAVVSSDYVFLQAKITKNRRWPRARDDRLRGLYAARIDPAMIAVEMGLTERTIINRLATLGLRSLCKHQQRERDLG